MELFFEILIAVLAVFGLWCAIRLLADAAFGSRRIGTVIYVSDEATARELPELLQQARHAPFRKRGETLLVLYEEQYLCAQGEPSTALRAMIARAGGILVIGTTQQ